MEMERSQCLPEGWLWVENVQQTVHVGRARVPVQVAGLCAARTDGAATICGSAAELGGCPLVRAHFELLERIHAFEASRHPGGLALVDWKRRSQGHVNARELFLQSSDPTSQRYSISNGVALHDSWNEARERAWLELVERDRVLRSWYGGPAPATLGDRSESWLHLLSPERARALRSLGSDYRLVAVEIPEPAPDRARPTTVAGVFGFPRERELPLFYGFGAACRVGHALDRAAMEGIQRLAFLWDEPPVATPPEPVPTPEFHQDYYLWPGAHANLEQWLAGDHHIESDTEFEYDEPARHPGHRMSRSRAQYVELRPATGERQAPEFHVVKAHDPNAFPLVFGERHPWVSRRLAGSWPVHPVA